MARRGTHFKRGPLDIDAGNWSIDGTPINSDVDANSLNNIGGLGVDLNGLTALINAANSGEEINRGRINLTASLTVTHGCAATPAAMIFNLGHNSNAADDLQLDSGIPVFFRWKAISSTQVKVYGFQYSGAAASQATSVDYIAIGDQN
jgi:hypothetical protein